MTTKTDGGPAFPSAGEYVAYTDEFGKDHRRSFCNEGITIRDYFAAKALQGLLGNSGGPIQRSEQSGWALTNCNYNDVATVAYMMADAMLAERDKS